MTEVSLAMAATDQGVGVSAFFTENMAAFREYAPLQYARLAQVQTPHSRLFVDDDGAIDIAFGDRRLYGEDAVSFTQRQIDLFFAAPERRYIDQLSFGFLDGLEGKYKRALVDALPAEGANLAKYRVDVASHFTLVFGLGLGLHIDPLIAFTHCAELIIVEPNFENLYHSLFVIDWSTLFEQAKRAGRAIHLVLDKDQHSIASHLRRLIRSGNPALLDGVYIYQHNASSVLTEAHQAFHRDFALHVLGFGFFEDELVMMANAAANMKRKDARVLTSAQLTRTEPVFICGSGPSIDSNLEVIAAQRDRAIVVSLGSALRTLLAHGIRPDFHVETENHPTNAANIERVAEEFGLTGITLLGALTVQPVMTELFDEAILYLRDSQSPAEVFGAGIEKMGSSGPTVANAALVTLLHLGFREIYMFGVDMGSRQIDKYHSSDTYIGRGESAEWAGDARMAVPANFGGRAVTETILGWSRAAFENVLKLSPHVRCINCSDGARVAHAIPMLPHVLDLENRAIDHTEVMDEVRGKMPIFPLDLANRIWRATDLNEATHDAFARVDAVLASACELDDPGLTWIHDLYELLDETKTKSPAVGIFLFGTTCMYLGTFWWFDGRIQEVDVRYRFRRAAVRELRSLYSDMDRRLSVLAADVGDCLAGQIARVNTAFDV